VLRLARSPGSVPTVARLIPALGQAGVTDLIVDADGTDLDGARRIADTLHSA
jgi:hypothetical protein